MINDIKEQLCNLAAVICIGGTIYAMMLIGCMLGY